ncbi:hypothetical protein ACOQFV_12620 [Nocardiopsis changdeensis]|uniref:Helix-turn-helix domain-containing protein n=1 Tax=Nocardiopsis changdeensis TaxID=2831969 RepID=A0ABX8BG13_9ACTN|nr:MULTISPECIES: hypothetical protein [Nocardiopsis]QUX21182.1 hypothetical protein KGD84_22440 [Nocardiopsis changdeensis]QYX37112.1 hypothetical protein K1J57_31895 [Nocardiopsis sp. MT53]
MRPTWNDPELRAGTKIKVALWLLDEVGEGNFFTKAQLREAFPGVEQVDRRMRDLRANGWVINTNREDPGLPLNTLCFVRAGDAVWDPRARRSAPQEISSKERAAVIAADDYMCTVCGIAGGEEYPDSRRGETAQLSVSARKETLEDGSVEQRYVTQCKRCKAGGAQEAAPQLQDVLTALDMLSAAEREELAQWVRRGRRSPRRVEQLWTEFRRLPSGSRAFVADRLRHRP